MTTEKLVATLVDLRDEGVLVMNREGLGAAAKRIDNHAAEIRRRVELHDRLVAALGEANEVLNMAVIGDECCVEAGVTSSRIDALLAEIGGDD